MDKTSLRAIVILMYLFYLQLALYSSLLELGCPGNFLSVHLINRRNKHGVPRETIAKMLDAFERPMNVDIVMNSVVPPHKKKDH